MLTVSNRYKTTLHIDGEQIQISVAKFTQDDDVWFNTRFEATERDEAASRDELERFRLRYRRQLAELRGVPLEQVDPMEGPLHAARLVGLLEAELGEDGKRERREAEHQRIVAGNAFAVEALSRYLAVERGQIYDADAKQEVLSGADFVRHFAARGDVLIQALSLIRLENALTAQQKKRLSSLSDSPFTSAPSSTDDGPRPDATAPPVGASATATTGRASGRRGRTRSGATKASNAASVPS